MTQLELANRLGFKYYAFVSQVEIGFARLPTEKIEAWAKEVGVDPAWFAWRLLAYYEPELHRVLYNRAHRRDRSGVMRLHVRAASLAASQHFPRNSAPNPIDSALPSSRTAP